MATEASGVGPVRVGCRDRHQPQHQNGQEDGHALVRDEAGGAAGRDVTERFDLLTV
jgi:hypothetical protein